MIRAKFGDMQSQRQFFIDVKKKLNMGSRKLAYKLGLNSRGGIESYTFMRTAPPVDIIKKLEKLSGINGNYEEVEGKIYRKKRGFLPLEPAVAEETLRKKFKSDFKYMDNLIKSDLSINEIVDKIRQKGYSFDNSKISRDIGAYRTNLLSEVVDKINITENDIVVSGKVRPSNKTQSLLFNLHPLYKINKKNKIRIGLQIREDRKRIRIFPLSFGRVLNRAGIALNILITEKAGFELGDNIEIVIPTKDFGFSVIDASYDSDAKNLAIEAMKVGFKLDNYRNTPMNHKGDLSLYYKNKNVLIEITKGKSYKNGYGKIGQCFVQKYNWPDSLQFLICTENLLTRGTIDALNRIKVKIVKSSFSENWEKAVINQIKCFLEDENR